MTRILLLATSCLLLLACSEDAAIHSSDGIVRVEPPFWWQGFKDTELQLLVYGKDVGELTPSIDYPGIDVTRVERGDSPNYLFVYLDIDTSANPGTFDIVFEDEDVSIVYSYELREKNSDAMHVQGFSNADVIYMITPDRFANGDPANDSWDGYEDQLDRSDDYGRHGGDLAGISQRLDYIRDMGFTAVWLNPVLENAMPESSYHGYAITDLYKVDPRFGNNDQYLALAQKMRSMDIGLVMDMVANHIGSAHWWMNDLPADDWLNVPSKRTKTSHARTTNQDPYASDFDKRSHADGWFSESMPDLNQRNPLLADYLVQNTIWWIEYLGLSGIRMDTHPYPDKQYMAEWSRRVMREYPDLTLTGEEWSSNPAIVAYWQQGKINHDGYESYMPSMLDFPLQTALKKTLTEEVPWWDSPWTSVYEMLGNDFLYPDPSRLVIFPDNHDMSRIYTQLDEDYDLYRMALVYYLTMRGIPTLYYGTEVLMSHPGTDSHGAIREEFPGGWADSDKNAFTGEDLSDDERDAQQFVQQLLTWRKSKSVIHTGKLMQYTPIKNVYAYFRYDDDDTVMVVFNLGQEAVEIDTARFAERLGDARSAVDVISGKSVELGEALELSPRAVLLLEVGE
ncbi:MAG: glycoside hydrolase family 13 protein [Woeseiaceae bacterium]